MEHQEFLATHHPDKLIASTALFYSLQLVTRNTKHQEKTGVKIVNPFTS
jgi:predicted nucleic acid-binding protein